MRQKLAWNMQDWMGVVLFGTEECDDDFGWKNIQTLQKLAVVTLDDLQRVRELSKDKCRSSSYTILLLNIYKIIGHLFHRFREMHWK